MLIDSHAHLFDPQFDGDRDRVIDRAREAGIEAIIVPGTTVESSAQAIGLAEQHGDIFACVGYHPHDAQQADDGMLKEIEAMSSHARVIAIGEIGLDFFYDFSPKERQVEVFRLQIEMAARRNLPIVVHTRDSIVEALDVVEEMVKRYPDWRTPEGSSINGGSGRGVFHCFSGTADQAKKLFSLGFTVSYPGIVTFKNSSAMGTLREIGYDRILLETDSPYLAPVPFRGKRNEPSHLKTIAENIAEAFSIPYALLAETTSSNVRRLFGIPS